MTLDALLNPFFLREARQHRRSLFAAQLWWLGCILVLSAVFALGLLLASRGPARQSPALILLCIAHTILCAITAGYGGDRLFGAEQRAGTLMGVLMLPLPPARWLALKLAFPVWGILTTWCVGLPFYVLAVIYQAGMAETAARYVLFPPVLALGALVVLLLLPPDFQERMQKIRSSGGGRGALRDPDLSVRMLLAWSLGYALFAGSIRIFMPPSRGIPFYSLRVPEWGFWMVLGACWLAAAWFSALASLLVTDEAERRGKIARSVAGIVILVVVLGAFWPMMNPWVRGIVLVYAAAVAFAMRKGQQRVEDGASVREMAWMQARRDDPMFIRDLRVLTRSISLRKTLIVGGGMLVLIALFVPLGATWLFTQQFSWSFHPAGWLLDAYIALVVALVTNARAAMFWTRDRSAQTLALLLMTPLSSREVLRGRIDAGLVQIAAGLALAVLLAVAGSILALVWGHGLPLLVTLTLLAVAGMQGVVYGSAWRPIRLVVGKGVKGDWELVFWWILYGLLLAGMVITVIVAAVLQLIGTGPGLGPIALVELALAGATAWTCWRGYLVRLRQMDAVRAGDLPIPE